MMNAGPTAERVFEALRARILEATFRPGDRLDPALLAAELNSSVTPIRDALHLLTGRGLVDARAGEGFHLPSMDAPGLEDLYAWNDEVLKVAIRSRSRARPAGEQGTPLASVSGIAELFLGIAAASGNTEHRRAIGALNDRLQAVRRAEKAVLGGDGAELEAMRVAAATCAPRALLAEIARYHRRRRRRAAEIVRRLYRGD